MAKEIERKFLVRSEAWKAQAASSASLLQAYIAIGEDRNVRVRIKDGQTATLTIKLGRNALVRDEFEYEIPVADAEELVGAAIGTVIEKTRHKVPLEGKTFEIDVYQGFYAGLVVAELELAHEDDRVPQADWLGQDVTGDERYSNMMLATNDLASELIHGVSHQAL